jgi:hypothetical protein
VVAAYHVGKDEVRILIVRTEGIMNIEALCWDEVGGAVAVWPSPVDHDVCFQAAGFTEFADTDEEWHEEFEGIVNRVIAWCTAAGQPRITRFVGIKGVPNPSVRDALLASARDDQFIVSVVSFGETLTVVTADGHPIIWLCGLPGSRSIEGALVEFAGEKLLRRVTLDWPRLMPDQVRPTA